MVPMAWFLVEFGVGVSRFVRPNTMCPQMTRQTGPWLDGLARDSLSCRGFHPSADEERGILVAISVTFAQYGTGGPVTSQCPGITTASAAPTWRCGGHHRAVVDPRPGAGHLQRRRRPAVTRRLQRRPSSRHRSAAVTAAIHGDLLGPGSEENPLGILGDLPDQMVVRSSLRLMATRRRPVVGSSRTATASGSSRPGWRAGPGCATASRSRRGALLGVDLEAFAVAGALRWAAGAAGRLSRRRSGTVDRGRSQRWMVRRADGDAGGRQSRRHAGQGGEAQPRSRGRPRAGRTSLRPLLVAVGRVGSGLAVIILIHGLPTADISTHRMGPDAPTGCPSASVEVKTLFMPPTETAGNSGHPTGGYGFNSQRGGSPSAARGACR
jgi:hypothetical protein